MHDSDLEHGDAGPKFIEAVQNDRLAAKTVATPLTDEMIKAVGKAFDKTLTRVLHNTPDRQPNL